MANRSYLSVWTRGFSEATMLKQFERILATIPCSASRPGYSHLLVQAVDPSETPVAEWGLRGREMLAADVTALTREHVHSDSAYIAGAHWDLWVLQGETEKWVREPQPLTLACHGPRVRRRRRARDGQFLGGPRLRAPLYRARRSPRLASRHGRAPDPAEAAFLARMAQSENLREYHLKTRENIKQLTNWVRAIEQALAAERTLLWSEGEDNFEARMDDILAVR